MNLKNLNLGGGCGSRPFRVWRQLARVSDARQATG